MLLAAASRVRRPGSGLGPVHHAVHRQPAVPHWLLRLLRPERLLGLLAAVRLRLPVQWLVVQLQLPLQMVSDARAKHALF